MPLKYYYFNVRGKSSALFSFLMTDKFNYCSVFNDFCSKDSSLRILSFFFLVLGRGEHIRYSLEDNNIPHEEILINRESWAELKPKTVCMIGYLETCLDLY